MSSMTPSRRWAGTVVATVAVLFGAAFSAGAATLVTSAAVTAVAEPDTNIQKPGHGSIALALDEPDTNIQKPGHRS